MICVLDMEHPHPETLNKKGHAASAITDGVNKVGSRLGLLKKKDKDEHKKSEEEKIVEKVIPDKSNDNEFGPKKSKETNPINDKQEEGKEDPIPPNPQEKPSADHVEINQKEKQNLENTNGIEPYKVDSKKDKPKQEEEHKESATRHIEFKEESEIPSRRERKPDEGSRSSEENGNNNHSSRFSTYDSNRFSTYGSNRFSTYSINQSGGNY